MSYPQNSPFLLSPTGSFVSILVPLMLIVSLALAQSAVAPPTKIMRHGGFSHGPDSGNDLVVPLLPFFLPAVNYSSGGNDSRALAVADLNHDNFPDVVAVNENGVGVLLGNGDGTLRPPVTYDSGGLFPVDVKAIDVNRDGNPDIVVINQFPPTLGVLLGNGDGTYQPALTYDLTGTTPGLISVVDVNRDGKPDVMIAASPGAVSVLLGNGDGTFQPAVSYPSGGNWGTSGIAVADLNSDNKMDLIVTNLCAQDCPTGEAEGSVGILLGNGDGTFQPAVTYDVAAYRPTLVVVADVNGDGKKDLVVTTCVPTGTIDCTWSTVSVLLGKGDGTFQPAATYNVAYGGNSFGLAVADINRDGKLDVIVTDYVLLGNGDGTFQSAQTTGSRVDLELSLVDINGDAKPDLVAAAANAGVDVQLHVGNTVSTTTLTSTPNPAVYGQETFSATVHSGSGTPTGSVFFYNELYGGAIGSAPLVGGIATLSGVGNEAGAGTNPIVAAYQGTVKYHPSLSAVVEQVLTKATTTTSVTSSLNPVPVGVGVTYTVNVLSQYGAVASGIVTCLDNGSNLKSLRGHPSQFRTKYAAPGTHAIVCSYPGDENNYPSTSPTLTEVALYKTATVLTTSGSPSVLGQPVTFTATVTSSFGAIPNGELVTFTSGGKVLGTASLSSGVAALTTSALSQGTHSVVATYAGDANFKTSHGSVTQVVTP